MNPIELHIQSLAHHRNIASLCMYYKFFNQPATSELKMCIPVLVDWPRCTRHLHSLHDLAVEIPKSRTSGHLRSFVPSISRLWNELLFLQSLIWSTLNHLLINFYWCGDNHSFIAAWWSVFSFSVAVNAPTVLFRATCYLLFFCYW